MTSPEITECPMMRTPRSHRRSSRLQGSQSLGGYCPDKLMPVKQQARRRGLGRGAKDNLQRKDSSKGSRQGAEQVLQYHRGATRAASSMQAPHKKPDILQPQETPTAHPFPPAQQSFLPSREMPVSAQPAGKQAASSPTHQDIHGGGGGVRGLCRDSASPQDVFSHSQDTPHEGCSYLPCPPQHGSLECRDPGRWPAGWYRGHPRRRLCFEGPLVPQHCGIWGFSWGTCNR